MSIIGTYRASGVGAVSGNINSNRVLNMSGFKPSGITDGNLLGVALFVYSANKWVPCESSWL